MIFRAFIYIAICATIAVGGVYFNVDYKWDDIKDYITLLSAISGIVFTIMGIWIAFLYPNALSRLVNQTKIANADFSETLEDTRRLENIVAAVLKSALVAFGLLAVLFFKLFLWRSSFYLSHIPVIKAGALALVTLSTVVQAEAVVSVMFANVMFLNDLHRKRLERKADNDL